MRRSLSLSVILLVISSGISQPRQQAGDSVSPRSCQQARAVVARQYPSRAASSQVRADFHSMTIASAS